MEFKYNKVSVATESINIDDIGNTCIKVITEEENFYYLATNTKNGRTTILQYGPQELDETSWPSNVDISYAKIDYSLKKLSGIINGYINVPKNKQKIISVQIVSYEDMLQDINQFINFYSKTIIELGGDGDA